MRHRNAGYKLGRNTSHRRALLRNLVTSILLEDRVETTITKAKAARPHVEKLITLGKRGDLHSRRLALSYLQTREAVSRLFDTVAPRYGDRAGGYLRIVRTGFQKGDGAEKAFIELLGSEHELDEKRQKRAEAGPSAAKKSTRPWPRTHHPTAAAATPTPKVCRQFAEARAVGAGFAVCAESASLPRVIAPRPLSLNKHQGFRVCVRTANFRIRGGSPRIYAGEGALQRSEKQSRLDHAL